MINTLCIVLCTLELAIGPGELLPPVWNDWALAMVPTSQRIYEVSRKFRAGGGRGIIGCCSCSQFCSKAHCAAIDLVSALLCQFCAAWTGPSHCCLLLCGRLRVCSNEFWNSLLDDFGIAFFQCDTVPGYWL